MLESERQTRKNTAEKLISSCVAAENLRTNLIAEKRSIRNGPKVPSWKVSSNFCLVD